MAIGSVPAAIFGVYVLTLLEDWLGGDFEDAVIALLAGALLLTGAATLDARVPQEHARARARHDRDGAAPQDRRGAARPVCVGFVLGVTSAGSGALIAVGLILLFRLTPQRVVGTDVFHAAILLWAAGLAHVTAGNVDFGLVGTILIGSVPGVWLGSHWSVRVEPAVLRTTLAVVLIGAGLALLDQGRARHPGRRDRALPAWPVIGLLVVTMLRSPKADRGRHVMVVMTPEATPAQIDAVVERLQAGGVHAKVMPGELTTAIGAIGDPEGVREMGLEGLPGVDRVIPISRPYKLASSELSHHEPTTFHVLDRHIGSRETFCLIAGPCTVESREQTLGVAAAVAAAGRLDAARRRLQAAHLAVLVPGARHEGARDPARLARRPACRS